MNDYPPCVHCGECCKVTACGFGEWDSDAHQCKFLIPTEIFSDYTFYTCAIFEKIILDPTSEFSPAFGAGCCRTLFNEARNRIIQSGWEAENGDVTNFVTFSKNRK